MRKTPVQKLVSWRLLDAPLSRGMTAMLVALALTASAPSPIQAQDYPTRPVTLVVPFVAGGGTEITARIVAHALEARLGRPVLVENKPGAGTVIGSNYVAKAAP